MTSSGFTLFDTALGLCALAWRDDTIVSVLLPEGGAEQSRARLKRRFSDIAEAPPTPLINDLITRIRELLDGKPVDLRE